MSTYIGTLFLSASYYYCMVRLLIAKKDGTAETVISDGGYIWVWLLSIAYSIFGGLVIYYTFIVTNSDPSDPTIKLERETVGSFDSNNYTFFCDICKTHVL